MKIRTRQNTNPHSPSALKLIFTLTFFGLLLVIQPAKAAAPESTLTHQTTTRLITSGPVYGETLRTTIENVTSFIISNEAPGHLVDWLIADGHGSETLIQVLAYLKAQSGGVISEAFYNQVAGAVPGSELFIATLSNYAGLVGGIEIGADGTISIPNVQGQDYDKVSDYMTSAGQSGQFNFTYTWNAEKYIYTHTNEYGGGVVRDYYAFGIAWRNEYGSFLPLVIRN